MRKVYKQKAEEKRPTIETVAGTFEKQNYIVELNKETGHKEIRPAGLIDTWHKVQASKDAADINSIIERYTRGDMSGFKDRTNAIYGDFSGVPDNMIDIANLKLKSDQAWEKLPLEVRREYGHDKDAYFADMGSEKWMKLHGFKTLSDDPIKDALDNMMEKETPINE